MGYSGRLGMSLNLSIIALVLGAVAACSSGAVMPSAMALSRLTVIPNSGFDCDAWLDDRDAMEAGLPSMEEAEAWQSLLLTATNAEIQGWAASENGPEQCAALYLLSARGDFQALAAHAELLDSTRPALGIVIGSVCGPGQHATGKPQKNVGEWCSRLFRVWFGVDVRSKAEFDRAFRDVTDFRQLIFPWRERLRLACNRAQGRRPADVAAYQALKDELFKLPEANRWLTGAALNRVGSITNDEFKRLLASLSPGLRARISSGDSMTSEDRAYVHAKAFGVSFKDLRKHTQDVLASMTAEAK